MDVGAIILHGSAQITSQDIQFAVANKDKWDWKQQSIYNLFDRAGEEMSWREP